MRLRRVATALTAVALATAAVPATAATADVATPACALTIADDEFDDVPDGVTHEHAIDCVAWWGITVGGADGRYGGAGPVTRGQIATFLARTLAAAGETLPTAPPMPYSDVPSGHPHRLPVAQLAHVGVVRAATGTQYEPGAPLDRASMAAFLVAAHERATGLPAPAGIDRFRDLAGHPDRDAINAAAALGFTGGFPDGTYQPSGTVTRAQMASFLTRVLDALVATGHATAPTTPAWGTVPPGRHRYLPMPDAPAGTYALYPGAWSSDHPRWNPCRTVPVVVDYAGAPASAERAVKDAIGKLAAATGLRFSYRTQAGLQRNDPFDPAPDGILLVDWPRTWEYGASGFGGWSAWGNWITTGAVSINRFDRFTQTELTSLLMHELGHAVGVDHPAARDQVMSTGGLHLTDWQVGDLAGLARVGRAAGCAPQPYHY